MNISIMTILTRVFFNSIIVFIQFFLLKNISKSKFLNSSFLFLGTVLFVFSLLFPIELQYTIEIPSTKILPLFQKFIDIILFSNFVLEITVFDILVIIWISGSIFKLFKLLHQQFLIKYMIDNFPKEKILVNLKNKTIRIFQLDMDCSPFVFNWKNPIIVLPKIDLTDKELSYIIEHELLHISNFDLAIKYCYEFLLVIYWWNPFAYLFRSQMNQILELRVDEQMVEYFTDEEKIQYIEIMIKISKHINYKQNLPKVSAAITSKKSLLLTRGKYILSGNISRAYNNSLFFLLICLLGIFLQTSIVFEPYSIKEIDAKNTFKISEDNSFLVLENNGSYKLYVDNNYVTTIQDIGDTLDLKSLKIYKNYEYQP